jgi:hypothetical protein
MLVWKFIREKFHRRSESRREKKEAIPETKAGYLEREEFRLPLILIAFEPDKSLTPGEIRNMLQKYYWLN